MFPSRLHRTPVKTISTISLSTSLATPIMARLDALIRHILAYATWCSNTPQEPLLYTRCPNEKGGCFIHHGVFARHQRQPPLHCKICSQTNGGISTLSGSPRSLTSPRSKISRSFIISITTRLDALVRDTLPYAGRCSSKPRATPHCKRCP